MTFKHGTWTKFSDSLNYGPITKSIDVEHPIHGTISSPRKAKFALTIMPCGPSYCLMRICHIYKLPWDREVSMATHKVSNFSRGFLLLCTNSLTYSDQTCDGNTYGEWGVFPEFRTSDTPHLKFLEPLPTPSRTVWPSATKFGVVTYVGNEKRVSRGQTRSLI